MYMCERDELNDINNYTNRGWFYMYMYIYCTYSDVYLFLNIFTIYVQYYMCINTIHTSTV